MKMFLYLQWDRFCAPFFNGSGGIPAGLQSDRVNDLWVADMRHGILKIDTQTKKCQQVRKAPTVIYLRFTYIRPIVRVLSYMHIHVHVYILQGLKNVSRNVSSFNCV